MAHEVEDSFDLMKEHKAKMNARLGVDCPRLLRNAAHICESMKRLIAAKAAEWREASSGKLSQKMVGVQSHTASEVATSAKTLRKLWRAEAASAGIHN